MRAELLYNPRLLCERLATESVRRRRLRQLKGTPAAVLPIGVIDSLELIQLAREIGIGTIYDIGANIGTWTLLAKSVIPDAEIHGFQPLPDLIECYRALTARLQGVVSHAVALGNENGSIAFHVTEFVDSSSVLRPAPLSNVIYGTVEREVRPVPVNRLDDFQKQRRLPLPDLLKLDVQGYELKVLQGATSCLAAAKAVIAEVSFVELYEGQCLFHELISFLAAAGFTVRAFATATVLGRPLVQADVLFMRSTT